MENSKFIKLTKKKKLEMKPMGWNDIVPNITIALFIPVRYKNDGYSMSAFFVKDKKDKWYRLNDYDCFRFTDIKFGRLKGDFENHGVQFFLGDGLGDNDKWHSDYGGEFKNIS